MTDTPGDGQAASPAHRLAARPARRVRRAARGRGSPLRPQRGPDRRHGALPADRDQRRARRRGRPRTHAVRRSPRRRPRGARGHGVLLDGRAALHPWPRDAGLPARGQRNRGLLGRADASGRGCRARAVGHPGAAPTGRGAPAAVASGRPGGGNRRSRCRGHARSVERAGRARVGQPGGLDGAGARPCLLRHARGARGADLSPHAPLRRPRRRVRRRAPVGFARAGAAHDLQRSGLVARPRLGARRHRARGRAGGARPPPRRSVAAAGGRSARQRAGERRRRLHGPDRAGSAGAPRGQGRLHGGAHPGRRAARRSGGRGARAAAGPAARAGDRRAPARRGQALGAQRRAPEAGRAHGRGVRPDQVPRRGRPRARARTRLLRPGRAPGDGPPRAARRHRLPARDRGAGRSTSRRASSRSATSSTRFSPSGSTARRGRSRTPSSCFARSPARRSTPPVSQRSSECSSASGTTPCAPRPHSRAVVRPPS